ncbi:MAG TPA: superoxide dismutase [Bacteroidales bacterium]|nr:superoxide dismutase [Bacteroidales bacterium]HPT22736.1 superoxide dismutase [Bacteroidales bacterium]
MAFELPKLPYKLNALVPYISEETLDYHYGKHHQTYVNNLNGLVPGTEFDKSDLETIIRKAEGGIYNNAAQVWNHTFYFESFSPSGAKIPAGILADAINNSFGSFDSFKELFTKAASTLFGSGWAWLVKNEDGTLQIIQESNAGNPLRKGLKPVMTCDVWEHAYYIDYRNKRPDYLKSFWEILDWDIISKRY